MTHRPPISRLPRDNGQVTQLINHQGRDEGDRSDRLSTNLGIETISLIPCYCDIQFLKKEFLTVFKYKQHPFTSQIEKMIGVLWWVRWPVRTPHYKRHVAIKSILDLC
jgi:hypothetical protein